MRRAPWRGIDGPPRRRLPAPAGPVCRLHPPKPFPPAVDPMDLISRSLPRTLVLAGACLALCGCGGGASVTGKITNNGQPLQVGDKGLIIVSFVMEGAVAGQGDSYGTEIQPD